MLTRDGILHARAERDGGPFYTVLCPACGIRLAVQRTSGAPFRFEREQDLPKNSKVREILRFFLGAPRGTSRVPGTPAPRGKSAAGTQRPPRGKRSAPGSASGRAGTTRSSGGTTNRAERAAPPPPTPRLSPRAREALAALGIPGATSLAQVKRHYRVLAKRLHPDAHPEAAPEELRRLEQQFARATTAYRRVLAEWPESRG